MLTEEEKHNTFIPMRGHEILLSYPAWHELRVLWFMKTVFHTQLDPVL